MGAEAVKELLEAIVKPLVDNPDEVVITETESESGDAVVYSLRVAQSDMGKVKVIGKQGRIAKAIRTVMKSASRRIGDGKKVSVDILD